MNFFLLIVGKLSKIYLIYCKNNIVSFFSSIKLYWYKNWMMPLISVRILFTKSYVKLCIYTYMAFIDAQSLLADLRFYKFSLESWLGNKDIRKKTNNEKKWHVLDWTRRLWCQWSCPYFFPMLIRMAIRLTLCSISLRIEC